MLLLTSLAPNCGLFLLHVHCTFTNHHQYTKALFYALVVFQKKVTINQKDVYQNTEYYIPTRNKGFV